MDNIEIAKLQLKGYGYKRIAKELSLSPNTVKSYIKRHPLDEVRAELLSVCLFCGKELVHTPGKKKKKYCSKSCRNKWQSSHPKKTTGMVSLLCECCGKTFFVYPSRATRYCSRECYIKGVQG